MTAPAADKKPARGPPKATARSLENAALHYLGRFAGSAANLHRVLMRRVERSARLHGTDRAQGRALVDAVVARLRGAGLLDDAAYAETRAHTLHRRGVPPRLIRHRLLQKGVDDPVVAAALETVTAAAGEPELSAAVNLARRRRLGPFRAAARAANRERDLAALARAGFTFEVARRVIEAASTDELEEGAAP